MVGEDTPLELTESRLVERDEKRLDVAVERRLTVQAVKFEL
jgi:hypothetical protein